MRHSLPDVKVLPDYQFNHEKKVSIYLSILKALKNRSSRRVKLIATFPGRSNYFFERMLLQRYPKAQIHCFENNMEEYSKIVAECGVGPKGVALIPVKAEDFIRGTTLKYDLLFFDYCGGNTDNITDIVDKHMHKNGILALTTTRGRGCDDDYPQHPHTVIAIKPEHYESKTSQDQAASSHMRFIAYRKVAPAEVCMEREGNIVIVQPIVHLPEKYKPKMYRASKFLVKKKESAQTEPVTQDQKLQNYLAWCAPWVDKLPPYEQHLITMYKEGKSQKQIAQAFGLTQGAVSSRLRRILERIKYYKALSHIHIKHMRDDLEPLGKLSLDIIFSLMQTTCQSETAKQVGQGMNQIKVRYRFEKCLAKLKPAMDSPYSRYKKYYKLLLLIQNNLYKNHQVALPHFNKGQYNLLPVNQPKEAVNVQCNS